jgi:HPt (histidine-containing phosphotransfer) domain-containing protein
MMQANSGPIGSSTTPLDANIKAEVVDMMDGDQELIIDLIDTMMESTSELMNNLTEGIREANALRIRDAAHALKSSSAQLGALPFSEVCRDLEQMGKNNQLAEAKTHLVRLMNAYQQMSAALLEWKTACS